MFDQQALVGSGGGTSSCVLLCDVNIYGGGRSGSKPTMLYGPERKICLISVKTMLDFCKMHGGSKVLHEGALLVF